MDRRTWVIACAAVVALIVGLLAPAGYVGAHADFVASSPPPYAIWNVAPTSVSVTVSEAVQPGSATITVTNLTGAQVTVGTARLSPTDPTTFSVGLMSGLRPSVFTVTWTAVSADDGHFTAGSFYFMVTYRDGTLPGQFPVTATLGLDQPISPLDVALEGADFVGFAIAFGGILLVGLLWAPLGANLEPPERTRPVEGMLALLRFARLGALAFLVAAAALWVENLVRVPPADLGGLIGSVFLLARALEAAVAAGIAVLLTQVLRRAAPEAAFHELPWEFLPLIFLGFVVILLEVAASHSSSVGGWWPLGPVADAVHLYGAALWVGGLLAILRARAWLRAPTPAVFTRDLLAAFSRFAFLGAFLVVSAGVMLGVILVGSVAGLLGTGYGWIVLAKGSLLAPMILLGAWNRRTLRGDASGERPEPGAVERLARNVKVEAVLGAAVLVLAGLLVTVNPAAAPQPQNANFVLQATSGGLQGVYTMLPYPSTPGDYVVELYLYNAANGTPFLGGGNGTITVRLVGGNATGFTLPLDGPHENHYIASSVPFGAPGTWDVEADVHGPSGAPVALTFTLTLHA